jgi:hypothetical protein
MGKIKLTKSSILHFVEMEARQLVALKAARIIVISFGGGKYKIFNMNAQVTANMSCDHIQIKSQQAKISPHFVVFLVKGQIAGK